MGLSVQDMLPSRSPDGPSSWVFLVDLSIYLAVMFLIREVYFSQANFIVNGLFWSFTGLLVAVLMMRRRNVSWRELGLLKPKSYRRVLVATAATLGLSVGSIMVFSIAQDIFGFHLTPDTSTADAVERFGDLTGNWGLFLAIIPFVWLESMLEEVLDRGFLINWIERGLSSRWFSTVIAVVLQAMIFGFRHSNDFSERSVTVGLIGLGMGVGYVVFGRNLWPPILAHVILNTISFMGRV